MCTVFSLYAAINIFSLKDSETHESTLNKQIKENTHKMQFSLELKMLIKHKRCRSFMKV